MKRLFVGIDTSNYTTSAALCDEEGEVLINLKKPLPVSFGERGLRQSDAVFHHTKALPDLMDLLRSGIESLEAGTRIAAVGYSYAPRDVEGSYMPCFLVGEGAAHCFASGANVPAYRFSHQAGHIMAALYSSGAVSIMDRPFASFHVSGGTTELVLVAPDQERIFRIEKIGGTLDLSAGQLIDRIGVKMGFEFPAGKFVDEAALSYVGESDPVRVNVKDMYCNISGAENQALSIFDADHDIARSCAFVLDFVSETILEMTKQLKNRYPDVPVLYAGGVMSSLYIKKKLSGVHGFHASPVFSADNAAGTALLAAEMYKRSHEVKS